MALLGPHGTVIEEDEIPPNQLSLTESPLPSPAFCNLLTQELKQNDIDIENIVKQKFKNFDKEPAPASEPEVTREVAATSLTSFEKELKAAMDQGRFDVRGVLANKWARELKADPLLSERYKQIKGRVNQQEFKAAWVSEKWDACMKTRTESQMQKEQTQSTGNFLPIPVVIKNQGGDEAAAEGVNNFIRKVLQMDEKSSIKKYIQINEWTGRVEIALPTKGWQDSFEKTWQISEIRQTSGTSSQLPAAIIKQNADKEKEKEDKDKEKNTKKRPKATTEEAEQKNKKQKTEKMIKDFNILKGAFSNTLTTANTLLRCMDEEAPWAWAKRLDEPGMIRSKVSALEQYQRIHEFWKDLLLAASMVEVRKKHSLEVIEQEYSCRYHTIKEEVASLKDITDTMMRMQQSRSPGC